MNSNIDVLKELEVKNREIYINKLNIDLDNNNEVLLITMDNVINLFSSEVISRILEINNKSGVDEEITKSVSAFYNKLKEEILLLLNNRYQLLKEEIKDINNIDYKENINKQKDIVINGIRDKYSHLIDKLVDRIEKINNEPNERIKDYLKILNYERFINKIKEILNNMNTILYNSYVDSSNKYQELNAKTLNK